jgi:hypothetical protein
MSERIAMAELLSLLAGDAELLERLCAEELVPRDERALLPAHLETARIVDTLVHELEVNWPGVEVILRLRTELLETRAQVERLVALLRERRGPEER